jgi:hypothetical protein
MNSARARQPRARLRYAFLRIITLVLCGLPGPLAADIPVPMVLHMQAQTSPGCPQKELAREVAAQRREVRTCIYRRFAGILAVECRFGDDWRATRCSAQAGEPQPTSEDGLDPKDLRCALRALSRMALHPPQGSPPPSGCVARIHIESSGGRRNRANRPNVMEID